MGWKCRPLDLLLGILKYCSERAYSKLIGTIVASSLFKWLWALSNLGTHKLFFWLLLRDRLNTKNLLKRKTMILDDYNCVLCNLGCEESSFHLFFECPFSRGCWATIPITRNLNISPLHIWYCKQDKTLTMAFLGRLWLLSTGWSRL